MRARPPWRSEPSQPKRALRVFSWDRPFGHQELHQAVAGFRLIERHDRVDNAVSPFWREMTLGDAGEFVQHHLRVDTVSRKSRRLQNLDIVRPAVVAGGVERAR